MAWSCHVGASIKAELVQLPKYYGLAMAMAVAMTITASITACHGHDCGDGYQSGPWTWLQPQPVTASHSHLQPAAASQPHPASQRFFLGQTNFALGKDLSPARFLARSLACLLASHSEPARASQLQPASQLVTASHGQPQPATASQPQPVILLGQSKLFTLRAPAEAIGRTVARIIGEPVRSVAQGIDVLWKA